MKESGNEDFDIDSHTIAEEDFNIDGLINKVTRQLSGINGCRKKYANLNEIFEQDFQYTDSIVIPTRKTLQCP